MGLAIFKLYDIQEISYYAGKAFLSTMLYLVDESDSESDSNLSDFDSEVSDFDADKFECGEITPEIKNLVDDQWYICDPLDEVFGPTTSDIIKDTVRQATVCWT